MKNGFASCSRMALPHILQTQQWKCLSSFLMTDNIQKFVATAIFRPNTPIVLPVGLSEASCVLKWSSNYWRFKTKHWSCHIEYFPRNFKESSAKHGDTCEYVLRRNCQSFSTFTVKSCKLFSNMFLYVLVVHCFNETRPTDCPFTPWVSWLLDHCIYSIFWKLRLLLSSHSHFVPCYYHLDSHSHYFRFKHLATESHLQCSVGHWRCSSSLI
jgi:hypothetical protein